MSAAFSGWQYKCIQYSLWAHSMFISAVFIFVGGVLVVLVVLLLLSSVYCCRFHHAKPVVETCIYTPPNVSQNQDENHLASNLNSNNNNNINIINSAFLHGGTFTPTTHEISNSEVYLFTYMHRICVCSCSHIMYSYSLRLQFEFISIWKYSQNLKQSNLPQNWINFVLCFVAGGVFHTQQRNELKWNGKAK